MCLYMLEQEVAGEIGENNIMHNEMEFYIMWEAYKNFVRPIQLENDDEVY